MHVSGIVVSYDSTAAAGARVHRVRLANGADLRADGEYTLVLNDFLATGGDGLGLSTAARRTEVLPIVDLDALVTYLRAQSQPVRAPTDARFVVTAGGR